MDEPKISAVGQPGVNDDKPRDPIKERTDKQETASFEHNPEAQHEVETPPAKRLRTLDHPLSRKPLPLEHVLLDLDGCAETICSFLHPIDAANLFATNQDIRQWSQCKDGPLKDLKGWWEDCRLLMILKCNPDLLSKVCKAYLRGDWHVVGTGVYGDEGAFPKDPLIGFIDFDNLLGDGCLSRPSDHTINFDYPEDVMEQIEQDDISQREKYECHRCSDCDQNLIYYFVKDTAYCQNCLTNDVYLAVAFAVENDFGPTETIWRAYEDNMMEYSGVGRDLKDDEFSVHFFGWCTMGGVAGYYFVGKGSRDDKVDYSSRYH